MPDISPADIWFDPRKILPAAKNALMYPVTHPAQTAEFGLSMAPGSGEAMAGVDAWNASGRASNALLSGNYGQAASEYGNMGAALLGAIPGAGVIARGTKRGAAWMDRNIPAGVNRLLDAAMPKDPQNTAFAIPAWHGSPHDFEQFSMEHIGKGEGAQAYGHGLYFAENPQTAKSYQSTLSQNPFPDGDPRHGAWLMKSFRGDDAARDYLKSSVPADKFDNMMQEVNDATSGRLYHTELDVEPHDLLDWDKPLSQQSEKVKQAVIPLAREFYAGTPYADTLDNILGSKLASLPGIEDVIPGIRYLDQGSRGAEGGTSNYVIFDDKRIKILKKE